ncbi:hypothetical protein ACSBR2_007126 [Camellia fascicularis]
MHMLALLSSYVVFLLEECEYNSWTCRGQDNVYWNPYCVRYILLLLWTNSWLEICKLPQSIYYSIFGKGVDVSTKITEEEGRNWGITILNQFFNN